MRFNKVGGKRVAASLGISLTLLAASGCQYYEISDPDGGRAYITDNWHMKDHRWIGGGVSFTDLHSGDTVTLQSSDIKPVSGDRAEMDIQGGAQSDGLVR